MTTDTIDYKAVLLARVIQGEITSSAQFLRELADLQAHKNGKSAPVVPVVIPEHEIDLGEKFAQASRDLADAQRELEEFPDEAKIEELLQAYNRRAVQKFADLCEHKAKGTARIEALYDDFMKDHGTSRRAWWKSETLKEVRFYLEKSLKDIRILTIPEPEPATREEILEIARNQILDRIEKAQAVLTELESIGICDTSSAQGGLDALST